MCIVLMRIEILYINVYRIYVYIIYVCQILGALIQFTAYILQYVSNYSWYIGVTRRCLPAYFSLSCVFYEVLGVALKLN